jgi:hypothetical protein
MKQDWISRASLEKASLSEFIISRVEENLTLKEVRRIEEIGNEIVDFDNIIGNNINQIARQVNIDNSISEQQLRVFYAQMELYRKEIKDRNSKIKAIYDLLYRKLM